jgi:hypothetical protein
LTLVFLLDICLVSFLNSVLYITTELYQIHRERDGSMVNMELLDVLSGISRSEVKTLMSNAVLQDTCEYYSKKSSEWIMHYSLPDYLAKVSFLPVVLNDSMTLPFCSFLTPMIYVVYRPRKPWRRKPRDWLVICAFQKKIAIISFRRFISFVRKYYFSSLHTLTVFMLPASIGMVWVNMFGPLPTLLLGKEIEFC